MHAAAEIHGIQIRLPRIAILPPDEMTAA